jgi:hypothetical protein
MARLCLKTCLFVFCLCAALEGRAQAGVSEQDFQVRTTRQAYALCTADAKDPLYKEAIHFCHGYLLGAVDYHEAITAGPEGKRLFCPPAKEPTRDEALALYLKWVAAHPRYMDEKPVETEFRFLMEQWPCPK